MPYLTTENCLLKICERVSNSLIMRVCICLQTEAIKAEHVFSLGWITWCGHLGRLELNLLTCDFTVYPRMLAYYFFFKLSKVLYNISATIQNAYVRKDRRWRKKKEYYDQRSSDGSGIFYYNSLLVRGTFHGCLLTLPCPLIVSVIFIVKWNLFVSWSLLTQWSLLPCICSVH